MFPISTPLTRRNILRTAALATAAPFLPRAFATYGAHSAPPAWMPLGTLAARKKIAFGFALNDHLLNSNPDYRALAARECTIVTPENAMKWEAVHPQPDEYSYDRADSIVAFAQAHSLKVRGHAFCWHRALPSWVTQDCTPKNAEEILRDHITNVAGHFKGKLQSWDVVNEAIQLKDGLASGWRNSFWYSLLGPRYVDIAFLAAKQADPAAVLTYNDFGLEYENHSDTPKRAAVLSMLRDLKSRGIPIGALGIQSHLRAGTGEHFGKDLPDFLKEVRSMGLEIYITELDVDDSHLTTEGAERDRAIADVYQQYLDLVLSTGTVKTVVTWGVWDIAKVTGAEAVSGPKSERPLLFSSDGMPKPDAYAVAEAFSRASPQN